MARGIRYDGLLPSLGGHRMDHVQVSRALDRAKFEASVYRATGERTFLEQDQFVGYDLPPELFERWWLQMFWNDDGKMLSEVGYREAGLSLLLMAAMVDAGDA